MAKLEESEPGRKKVLFSLWFENKQVEQMCSDVSRIKEECIHC